MRGTSQTHEPRYVSTRHAAAAAAAAVFCVMGGFVQTVLGCCLGTARRVHARHGTDRGMASDGATEHTPLLGASGHAAQPAELDPVVFATAATDPILERLQRAMLPVDLHAKNLPPLRVPSEKETGAVQAAVQRWAPVATDASDPPEPEAPTLPLLRRDASDAVVRTTRAALAEAMERSGPLAAAWEAQRAGET